LLLIDACFEEEDLGVSNPKLLSLWSESNDNVEGERDLSLFREGTTTGGDLLGGWTWSKRTITRSVTVN